MRKHRNGERATNQSKAWKLRRDDYSEGAEDVEAGWEAQAVEVPLTLNPQEVAEGLLAKY
jgi:hypothetical protein